MRSHPERSAAALRKICNEDVSTISLVTTRLVFLSPDGSDDDVWLVWHRLATKYANHADYRYTSTAIRWAWRAVRQARNRTDHHGAGWRRAETARRRALAKLAAELGTPQVDLLRIDVNDCHSVTNASYVATESGRDLVALSRSAARATANWFKIRGCQRGLLFDLPKTSEFLEELCPDPDTLLNQRSVADAASQAELEETLEQLCRNKSPLACAFVLQNMVNQGGDWSTGVVQRLQEQCGALGGHVFTKSERRTCRKAFKAALREEM